MILKLFALVFEVNMCYHQGHPFQKISYFIKADGTYKIIKQSTPKISLSGSPKLKHLFLYEFEGFYHFNYMRLNNASFIDPKTCSLIDHCCFVKENVVLEDSVLKEIASFCNPYALENMITAVTGVDIPIISVS